MSARVVCASGGTLLGADSPLASRDAPAVDEGQLIACGALVCRQCKAPVKTWDGQRWKLEVPTVTVFGLSAEDRKVVEQMKDELPRAYDAAEASQFLEPFRPARAYACRCTRVTLTFGVEDAATGDRGLPWICSGHPS